LSLPHDTQQNDIQHNNSQNATLSITISNTRVVIPSHLCLV
jgi:hypothetical protein